MVGVQPEVGVDGGLAHAAAPSRYPLPSRRLYQYAETTETTESIEGSEMSALLNEDERALRDAVRSFLDRKVAPLVAAHEQARTFPWDLLPPLYDFGYVRGGVAEAAGGDGLPMIMQAILMEEAGRCWG